MDLRMLLLAVRRHKAIFAMVVVLGVLAGAAFTVVRPPLLQSKVLVVVPGSKSILTEVVIASSDPVLLGARRTDPALAQESLETLRNRVKVTSVTGLLLAITAEARTAAEAEAAANAIARSYVTFVGSKNSPGGQIHAQVAEAATPATGPTMAARMAETAALGAVLGALIGGIIVIGIGRTDRRLRERDEIAAALGAPVLASIPVLHPTDAAGWIRVLEDYEPGVVHAWSLRKALRHVGVTDGTSGNGAAVTLAVVSLSSDRRALAIGPQLAVYAASLGIPTTLVIGPRQESDATSALSAACTMTLASVSGRPSRLQFAVGDHKDATAQSGARLTVVVAVVDSRNPRAPAAARGTATLLGVSAGAATAEQLARVAVGLTGQGRDITGVLVADPDRGDRTTGRLPQFGQPTMREPAQHRQSARPTGTTAAETRR